MLPALRSRGHYYRTPEYVPDAPSGSTILGEAHTSSVEARLLTDENVLWVGTFEDPDWKQLWGVGTDTHLANQATGTCEGYGIAGTGPCFRAKNPANTNTGFGFFANFAMMGEPGEGLDPRDEVYFRYRVLFPTGYAFKNAGGGGGGKLPGLSGKNDPAPTNDSKVGAGGQRWNNATMLNVHSGGDSLQDADGFSARLIWHKEKRCLDYLYVPSPIGTQSSSSYFGASAAVMTVEGGSTPVQFTTNVWHTLEQRIVMNTPGTANGIEEIWFDGTLGRRRTNVMWRGSSRSDLKISSIYFGWFFGGGSADQPATDQYVFFKDAVLSTAYIGPRAD